MFFCYEKVAILPACIRSYPYNFPIKRKIGGFFFQFPNFFAERSVFSVSRVLKGILVFGYLYFIVPSVNPREINVSFYCLKLCFVEKRGSKHLPLSGQFFWGVILNFEFNYMAEVLADQFLHGGG